MEYSPKNLELLISDNQGNAGIANEGMRNLIERNGVSAMIGALDGSSFASVNLLKELKIPIIVVTAPPTVSLTRDNPWVFRMAPTAKLIARKLASNLAALNIKQVDFLIVDDNQKRELTQAVTDKGISLGIVEIIERSAEDLNPQFSKLNGSRADALIVATSEYQAPIVLRKAYELGMKQKIITAVGLQATYRLIANAGASANGTYHLFSFDPSNLKSSTNPALAQSFVEEWKKKSLPQEGLAQGYQGYDALKTIAAAIAKAGRSEPVSIRDALWSVKVSGVGGNIVFRRAGPESSRGGQSISRIHLAKIENGKLGPCIVCDPPECETCDPPPPDSD